MDYDRLTDGAAGAGPTAATAVPERYYAPQIDGLRFIAALLVILHHGPTIAGLKGLQEAGWVGVDLFLCISAFLLTRLLRLEFKKHGQIRVRYFFIRRALRIWPLYFCFAASMCLAAVVFFGVDPRTSAAWMLSHLSFSANLMTAAQGFSPVSFTAHLWTIPLEEQAYFVIPFLILAFCNAGSKMKDILVFAGCALTILVIGRAAFFLAGKPAEFVFVLPFRSDAFVLGATLSVLLENRRPSNKPLLLAGVALGVAFLAFAGKQVPGPIMNLYPLAVIGCASVLLLAESDGPFKRALSHRPIVWFGKVSYGIYVYHLLCIKVADRTLELVGIDGPIARMTLAIGLTLAVASASYLLFESYFLRVKERFTIVPSRAV